MNLYCPSCQRIVGGKRVFDAHTMGAGAILGAVVGGIAALIAFPAVLIGSVFAGRTIHKTYEDAPLVCPLCNIRLLNPSWGESEAVYKTKEEAEQVTAEHQLTDS